jgi:hypothetical protein
MQPIEGMAGDEVLLNPLAALWKAADRDADELQAYGNVESKRLPSVSPRP